MPDSGRETRMPETVLLDHGAGGRLAHDLTTKLVLPIFDNAMLAALNDGAILNLQGTRLAFSTDSYTVDPIFFPGGNIGELAVNGTVNDIAMCGGTPFYLSAGLIIEEGLAMDELEEILKSMGTAAQKAGAKIVTGDTKVVPRGVAGRILINTTSVGMTPGIQAMPVHREILRKDMVVMDIVYNPLKTRLLKEAEDIGCVTVGGVSMFVHQGAIQFEMWTGKKAPMEVMKQKVTDVLKKRETIDA